MNNKERREEEERLLKAKRKAATRRVGGMFVICAFAIVFVRFFGTPQADKGTNSAPTVSSSSIGPEESDRQQASQEKPAKEMWCLVLVDSTHPVAEDFRVGLTEITGGQRVDSRVAELTEQMLSDAKKNGSEFSICSGYRTVSEQKTLFEQDVEKNMKQGLDRKESERKTARTVQPAGCSEHHTGLAIDIITPDYKVLDEGIAGTQAYKWLQDNAWRYGFVLRYPKEKEEITGIDYEPWHYRYVGLEHAEQIKDGGLCLEEYLELFH